MNDHQLLHAADVAEERATRTARNSSLHGPRHWRDVARIGALLVRRGVEADLPVVALFAALHDTQRRTDSRDPEHGERAAAVAAEMRADGILDLGDSQWTVLRQALIQHDEGLTSADPTVGACWDADRLTLPRVSYRVKRSLLSTQVAADCVREACLSVVKARDVSWADALAGRAAEPHRGPYTLYRGTTSDQADRIRQNGLYRPAPGCGIYFTPDKQIAYQYAHFRTNLQAEARIKEFKVYQRALQKKMRAGELTDQDIQAHARRHKTIVDDSKHGVIITVQLPEDWPFAFRDHDFMGYATRSGHIGPEYITAIESVTFNAAPLRVNRIDKSGDQLDQIITDRELLMTVADGQELWPPSFIPEYLRISCGET